MAKLLKLRRGTTTQHGSFTGAEGEVTVDTDKETLVVHDGSTAGGHPVAAEDMANVSSASIAGRLANDSIATSKIAAGALPSDVTVASANIVDGTIAAADLATTGVTAGAYGSSSAIPIVTVNNKGQVTAASTTAIDSTTIANGTSNVAVANNGDITATRSGTARLVVDNDGVDVTGQLTVSSNTTISGNNLNMSTAYIDFSGSISTPSTAAAIYRPADNSLAVSTVDTQRLLVNNSGISVTGNVAVSGTVDGVDVATRDTLFGGLTSSSGVLTDGVTATTQSASDNSTKVATTAYVTTGIANAQAFPSGTKMLFQQTSAPTGWTKVTSGVNNHALRVVSGTAGSGGNAAFTTVFANRGITANSANTTQGGNVSVANSTAGGNVSVANASTGGNVNSHTLSTSQMPSHSHSYGRANPNSGQVVLTWESGTQVATNSNSNTSNTGGGGSHSHGFTGGSHNHNASFSGSAHNHNATFSGSAHNHSISVSNLDMQVEYLDVIIAAKD